MSVLNTKKKAPLESGALVVKLYRFSAFDLADVHSIGAFTALFYFELHLVAFVDTATGETGDVNEDLLATGIFTDKTVALGGVEEFYYSCFHCDVFGIGNWCLKIEETDQAV